MKFSFEQKVALTADNGANMNNIPADVLEGLVKYQFRSITCSIDGVSEETYGQYRRGGKLQDVLTNIGKINDLKRLHQSPYPILNWQFIAFSHNVHEIQRAKEKARALSMSFSLKHSWDAGNAPDENSEYAEEVRAESGTGFVNRDEYLDKTGELYASNDVCSQLWHEPQINYDGRVLGCCANTWGDYGNAFDQGLTAVLEGERYKHAQLMLTGSAEDRSEVPCSSCPVYIQMKATSKFLRVGPSPEKRRFLKKALKLSKAHRDGNDGTDIPS